MKARLLSSDMELLLLLCLCFLTLSGLSFGDQSGKTVKEGDDVILPCSLDSKLDIESGEFEWMKEGSSQHVFKYQGGFHSSKDLPDQNKDFEGRVEHFPDGLRNGNASIVIKRTKVTDSGNYTCTVLTPERHTFHVELIVDGELRSRENIPGAAPRPYVKVLDAKGSLQCEVQGAKPEPTVEWWDSKNQIIDSKVEKTKDKDGYFHITIQATVNQPGWYRCVSTQNSISHRVFSDTYVPIVSGNSGLGVGVGVVIVIALSVIDSVL